MGLIADIAASFATAIGGNALAWHRLAQFKEPELEKLKQAAEAAAEAAITASPAGAIASGVIDLEEVARFTVQALRDPVTFIAEKLASWSRTLNKALALLNVDAPAGPGLGDLGDPTVAAQVLASQSELAQQRVAGAIAAINLVIAVANAVSMAAEMASAGRVRTIAEAIQSWIWANGLGQLSSMAYQPQLSASVIPWLNRYYAQRSQAQLPGESDLIRFQLREVFEPTRRKELLEFPSSPTFDGYMAERGLSKYWADSYWAAHWVLPSIGQLNEMLHRGEIDEVEWERFVRFNDFDPSSIPRLKAIIYSPFTRVDARRMHRLGVLDDEELLQAYADIGFYAPTVRGPDGKMHAEMVDPPDFTRHKAQALVVWTKMFNALPVLRQRFRNGHIDSGELLAALEATGIGTLKARELWETIAKAGKEERVTKEKQLTRALITRAWKDRFIGFEQALFLLQRLGWDRAEAELIVRIADEPAFDILDRGTNLGVALTGAREPSFVDEIDEDG